MIFSYMITKRNDRYSALIEVNLGDERIVSEAKGSEVICQGALSNGFSQSLYALIKGVISTAVNEGNEKGQIDLNTLENKIKRLIKKS